MDPSSEVVSHSFSLRSIREPEKIIEEFFSFLESFDKKVVLAIDGFEKLASFREVDGLSALGKIIESHSSVRMIFSVYETQGSSIQFLEKYGVVFRSSGLIHLEPIEFSEYCSFARSKFQKAGKRISAEIFESFRRHWTDSVGFE